MLGCRHRTGVRKCVWLASFPLFLIPSMVRLCLLRVILTVSEKIICQHILRWSSHPLKSIRWFCCTVIVDVLYLWLIVINCVEYVQQREELWSILPQTDNNLNGLHLTRTFLRILYSILSKNTIISTHLTYSTIKNDLWFSDVACEMFTCQLYCLCEDSLGADCQKTWRDMWWRKDFYWAKIERRVRGAHLQ